MNADGDKIYTVYIHTFPNNKVYIGITKRKVENRWGTNGIKYSGQTVFNAILKYGWINIKHDILADNLTMEEAKKMERDMIKKYQSYKREHGYNESMGGDCFSNVSRYKPVCMYDINGNLLKTFESIVEAEIETDSTDIWGAVKGRKKTVNGYVWRYLDDPFDKYAIKHENNSKQVCQYDVMGNYITTFPSISQAERETGCNSISDCCNGKRKMSNRFVWRFVGDDFHKYDDIYDYNTEIAIQYDRKGNFIAEYELYKARKIFGENISDCMRGRMPTAYNYVWRNKGDSFSKYHVYDNTKYKLPICQYNRDGELLHTYQNHADIKIDGIDHFSWSAILRCIRGERPTAYGYIWKFKAESDAS